MLRLFASSAGTQPQSKVRLRSSGRTRPNYPRERRLLFESLEDRRVLTIDLVSRGLPDPLILRVDSVLGSTSSISADGRYVVFSTNDRFELDGPTFTTRLTR